MSDIQKADPAARRRAIWIVAIGSVFGALAILSYQHFESRIYEWIEKNIELLTSTPELPFLFSLVLVSPLLFLSTYLFVYGHRAARARRLPPPGYAVARDTPVHIGKDALVRARIVQILSLVIALAGAMIPVFFWYVFSNLTTDV